MLWLWKQNVSSGWQETGWLGSMSSLHVHMITWHSCSGPGHQGVAGGFSAGPMEARMQHLQQMGYQHDGAPQLETSLSMTVQPAARVQCLCEEMLSHVPLQCGISTSMQRSAI